MNMAMPRIPNSQLGTPLILYCVYTRMYFRRRHNSCEFAAAPLELVAAKMASGVVISLIVAGAILAVHSILFLTVLCSKQ